MGLKYTPPSSAFGPNVANILTVANEAERLALTSVDVGDLVRQLDNGEFYRLVSTPPSDPASWEIVTIRVIPAVPGDIVGAAADGNLVDLNARFVVDGGAHYLEWTDGGINYRVELTPPAAPPLPVAWTLDFEAAEGW